MFIETGAYCQARMRLPKKFFATIARAVGTQLQVQAEQDWLWKGRRVYMFDGTTISMPDTPSNQQAYPQPTSQTPGVGFPLARVGRRKGDIVDIVLCSVVIPRRGRICYPFRQRATFPKNLFGG